jgi:hypothetical protein
LRAGKISFHYPQKILPARLWTAAPLANQRDVTIIGAIRTTGRGRLGGEFPEAAIEPPRPEARDSLRTVSVTDG